MQTIPCQRFWEGAVGITLTPRKQNSGEYFWTFAFVRAYKRKGSEKWEYAQHYGKKHAEALGRVMGMAYQFMEQNTPATFVEEYEAANAAESSEVLGDRRLPPANARV